MTSTSISSFSRRRCATVAGIFSVALSSVLLLCGAGSVPIENLLPQGAMQADFNAGGHSITNAAAIQATNYVSTPALVLGGVTNTTVQPHSANLDAVGAGAASNPGFVLTANSDGTVTYQAAAGAAPVPPWDVFGDTTTIIGEGYGIPFLNLGVTSLGFPQYGNLMLSSESPGGFSPGGGIYAINNAGYSFNESIDDGSNIPYVQGGQTGITNDWPLALSPYGGRTLVGGEFADDGFNCLQVYGTSSLDYGTIYTNGSGGLTVVSLVMTGSPPSSSSDTGVAGQLACDSNYFYVCVGANTWKRAALSTW